MGPFEKAISDISDIMSAIDLPDKENIIPDFRNQTITELEDNFTFMIELFHHINEILDNIGGI